MLEPCIGDASAWDTDERKERAILKSLLCVEKKVKRRAAKAKVPHLVTGQFTIFDL